MAQVEHDGDHGSHDKAPRCRVRDTDIVNIEHPCIIKNLDRGIKSLGGLERLNDFLNLEGNSRSIGVSLRPDDDLAKSLSSRRASRHDLLLRVTMPKRTGRKRKRGCNEPYAPQGLDPESEGLGVPFLDSPRALIRSLRDNVDRYSVEVVGTIRESHRFRSIPDSQYATSTNSIMKILRKSVLHLDPENIKNFNFTSTGEDVGPPAHFTPRDTHDIPNVYSYKQNATVEVTRDEQGNVTTRNVMKAKLYYNHSVEPDAETVPDAIPSGADIGPEEEQPKKIREWITKLRESLETERPIMTKRYITDLLGSETDTRFAWAYCGYVFRSGPWRDALVKFGVDPRKDPALRKYQCLMFKIESGRSSAPDGVKPRWQGSGEKVQVPEGVKGYEFDGKSFFADGKVYQLCDITDPLLKGVVDLAAVRAKYSPVDGWYEGGTLAKLRIIMKHKLDTLAAGKVPDDDFYTRLMAFPDRIASGSDGTQFWRRLIATDGRGVPSKEEQELSEKIRTLGKAAKGKRKVRSYSAPDNEREDERAQSAAHEEGDEDSVPSSPRGDGDENSDADADAIA